MIIANITGGLGNQFFQFAVARHLAEKHRTDLLLDLSGYKPAQGDMATQVGHRAPLLFNFNVAAQIASGSESAELRDSYVGRSPWHRGVRFARRWYPNLLWKNTHVREAGYRFQEDVLKLPDNRYLEGFWQSEKYFNAIKPIILRELVLRDSDLQRSATERVSDLRRQFGTVISVHVRRGDLTHAFENLKKGHLVHGRPMGLEYFHQAMEEFSPDGCFFIFSDSSRDISWCKENVKGKNLFFSDASSELWDFAAMKSCDHHIISNSTFSWWAAWLNNHPGRRVIAPSVWSGSEARVKMDVDDLIPSEWKLI